MSKQAPTGPYVSPFSPESLHLIFQSLRAIVLTKTQANRLIDGVRQWHGQVNLWVVCRAPFWGPWGAAIGVGLGHQVDKGVSRVRHAAMLIQVVFSGCLAKMAKADGVVTKEEINAVEQIITRLGYTPRMREAAIDIFRKAKDDLHSAADYIDQLAEAIQLCKAATS